jgi:hypothetical protein
VRPADLPDGWRWETYRDIQIGVPGDWGYGSGEEMVMCRGRSAESGQVGRPLGAALGCPLAVEHVAAAGYRFVALTARRTAEVAGAAELKDDLYRLVTPYVTVWVQAEQPLRERILATMRTVRVDAYGCPTGDAVSADPARPPRPAADLARTRGVRAISVCRYVLYDSGRLPDAGPGLFSSSRLTGAAARELVRGLARAPADRGLDNNDPATCSDLYRYGRDLTVLLVDSARGRTRVHVVWNGCDRNGVHDGVRVRRLTEAVRPLFQGPHQATMQTCKRGKVLLLGPEPARCR